MDYQTNNVEFERNMRLGENIAALLVIFTCAAFQKVGCCSRGWLVFDTQCVKIFSAVSESNGRSHFICILERATLLSASSAEMLKFLSIHTSSYSQMKFWVDVADSEKSVLVQGQPGIRRFGSCFIFRNGTVEPSDCINDAGTICIRPKPMHDPTENCQQGLTQHSFIGEETGNCVYRTSSASTHGNALAKCAENGGRFLDLDEIMRDGLTAFHEHQVMMDDRYKYWTNLKMNGTSIIWQNAEHLHNGTSIFWKNAELLQNATDFVPGNGQCIQVSFSFASFVRAWLYQTECEDHAFSVCAGTLTLSGPVLPSLTTTQQSDVPKSCPAGHSWKVYHEDCFWETSYDTGRMSWNDARSHCQAYGGDLSSFHSSDEEKTVLSFPYGTLPSLHWIGLRLDRETETYKWSDGTLLDYENWAPGHPNHKDKRLQCVSIDAQSNRWMSTLCGMISWFICRVPKGIYPLNPVVPTPKPLEKCESDLNQFYFQGYCYTYVIGQFNWHRSEEYCENQGSRLVSIHSDEEIGFLLRMLYESKPILRNRVWIGLNSLRNGVLRWSDYSPIDFTYWNTSEPKNVRNLEKCCSMNAGNGLWNDDICNEKKGFICKRPENATITLVIPTTPDPTIGNCRKGWYAHHDRCYLPIGYVEKDRVNWTEASTICESRGGYLVSIRDSQEQAFLTYLMQGLQEDTWIGLHDTIHSMRYYWLDNSDIQYTNWDLGEPSFFGIQEDCVKMVYDSLNSGVWKDDICNKKLPFICYAEKDPTIPKPNYNRGLNCIYPPDWLKLGDMCFKMYAHISVTWEEAEAACRNEGAHMVSISETQIQAVATYLGMEVNQTFWIGLQYKEDSQQFEWLNGRPVSISKWGQNEPSSSSADSLCYASTSDGTWGRFSCHENMSYICQIAPGKVPARKAYTGNCHNSSVEWKSTEGSYCHLFENSIASWFFAYVRCTRYGSDLISFHSLKDLEMVRKHIKPEMRSIFIGLMRNEKGGFSWSDLTPVDFVNWDEGEPGNERYNCVEMVADTLKWKVVKCDVAKHYICSAKKDQLVYVIPGKYKLISDSTSGLSAAALTGILVCSLILVAVILAAVFLLRPALGKSAFRIPFRQQSVSYENALYNVDSMEFQNDSL